MNDAADPTEATSAGENLQSFLKLETRGLGLAARTKKLKAGDVLVAVDGEPFTGDAEMLALRLGKPVADSEDNPEVEASENDVVPHLLTFWRGGVIFHVIFETRIKAAFEVTGPEETLEILGAVQKLKFAPLESYQNFEVFRDVRKNAALHSTDMEEIATIAPVLWMLNHRLYYPMVAVMIVYGITLVAHWFVFVISYFLVSVYTKRAQVDLLRSYKMFEDKFFWLVLAEPSEAEARATCRLFVPDLRFANDSPPKTKSKTRNPNRVRVNAQQAG